MLSSSSFTPLTSFEIPLSTRVVDECTQSLFGGNEDQDTQLFAQAMIEATDFLMAEVYPSFEKLPLDHFERKQSIDVRLLNCSLRHNLLIDC
jgi:hypothetical protein